MSRPTIEARRISTESPAELTLDVLQQRLNQAEGQANNLGQHVQTFGFKQARENQANPRNKEDKFETGISRNLNKCFGYFKRIPAALINFLLTLRPYRFC